MCHLKVDTIVLISEIILGIIFYFIENSKDVGRRPCEESAFSISPTLWPASLRIAKAHPDAISCENTSINSFMFCGLLILTNSLIAAKTNHLLLYSSFLNQYLVKSLLCCLAIFFFSLYPWRTWQSSVSGMGIICYTLIRTLPSNWTDWLKYSCHRINRNLHR